MKISSKKKYYQGMLSAIGEDPDRQGLRDAPKRVIKMWREVFRGYNKKFSITTFDNKADGVYYDQMIVDSGHFFSYCKHHLVPFFGIYYFTYIPDKKIIGLSKVARTIDFHENELTRMEFMDYFR